MSRRFVITSLAAYGNRLFAGYFDDHKLCEVNAVSKEPPLIGRIYAGKVVNVSPNMDACFVSCGEKLVFYLPFEDLDHAVFLKRSSVHKKICAGDELLVRVVTEPIKTKNAVCSTKLLISGTFCVVTAASDRITASKKLGEADKRKLTELAQSVTDGKYGVIMRTNAKNADEKSLTDEILSLGKKLSDICEYGKNSTPYSCLYSDRPEYIGLLADIGRNAESIVTDDVTVYEELMSYAKDVDTELIGRITLYDDSYPLAKLYSFESQVEKALRSTVNLRSGANIVITQTEALTVIDVNTGSNIRKSDKKTLIFNTNTEAAAEIAFQLRLRNISGIIIIDFIDMTEEERKEVESVLRQHTKEDKCRVTVEDFTKLGLLELTRQKKRRSLSQQIKDDDKK